tara:strand:- start:1341 stop:1781 length:441 start_codon:yes stop_codon:yes gene_type:complete
MERTPESHPPGYNGLYSAVELKNGIINFILKDREQNGDRLLATEDIVFGLKTMYNIEFDFHSVEYVMKNMLSKEGSKQVGTTTSNSVIKKCEDGIHRTFVTHRHNTNTHTQDQLKQLYLKLCSQFAYGITNKDPGTFPEFKKNLGY